MPTLDDLETLAKFSSGLTGKDLVPLTDESADGSGSSKVRKLSASRLAMGYTHAFKITHANAALVADTGTDITTISLMSLPQNTVVQRVTVIVPTNFTGGSVNAATLDVGRTGDVDEYVDALNVFSNANVTAENTGTVPNVQTASSQDLTVSITPSNDGTDAFDQGEAYILVALIDTTELDELGVETIA